MNTMEVLKNQEREKKIMNLILVMMNRSQKERRKIKRLKTLKNRRKKKN